MKSIARLRKDTSRGFTLVEVLVVMAIIAILMGLVLGGAVFAMERARRSNTSVEMERIAVELNEYLAINGIYPPDQQAVLDYLEERKVENVDWIDAWGREYIYERSTKQTYILKSQGRLANDDSDDLTAGKSH